MTDANKVPLYRFLSPRYWPLWLGFGILRAVCFLPYSVLYRLGNGIGRLMPLLSPKRFRIARINIDLCLPELSEEKREQLLRDHMKSLGVAVFETGLTWWASNRKLAPLYELEGEEHIKKALEQGRGAILLSGHVTMIEVSIRLLTIAVDFHPMYRQHNNPFFEEVMRRTRDRNTPSAINKKDVKTMIRCLRANGLVWYAPDQAYRRRNSVMAPFFSIPAPSNTGTTRLAKITGAPVIPFFPQRKPDGSGYRLILLPPLENFPGEDAISDTTRINQLLEKRVRHAPEQYLWVHKRFKSPDPEAPDVYA